MKIKINPEPPIFDENFLNVIGNSFTDHTKGISEWLKNSIDAYIREGIQDSEQKIILNFVKDIKGRSLNRIECIDFVGTTYEEVDKALKVWGNPEAASRGKWNVYGGHGNGGKFYMRQMFEESFFITYKNSFLTIFGFDKNKKYGFDVNFKGTKVSLKKALEAANINEAILNYGENISGEVNFTVVRGINPKKMGEKKLNYDSIITSLIKSPQARQILKRTQVSIFIDDKLKSEKLKPEIIKSKQGYEDPIIFKIPSKIKFEDIVTEFPTKEEFIGELILKTSEDPFSKKDNILNSIDIIGKVGIVASYQISELNVKNKIGADFIYGECKCSILELEEVSSVQNDRTKLVENNYSLALLNWISQQIDEIAKRIQEEEKNSNTEAEKNIISYLNKILHSWSKNFFNKFIVDIYGGMEEGSGFGGRGSDGFGKENKGNKKLEKNPRENNEKGGQGDKKIKKPQFPQVLVTGVDKDPFTGEILILSPRQNIVYQRPEDIENHLWWINAQQPFADKILREETPDSYEWKQYLFQRYIEIIIFYAIEEKWKEEPNINPFIIQDWIIEVLNKIYNSAYNELKDFLFE
jgi:hypothetical protein